MLHEWVIQKFLLSDQCQRTKEYRTFCGGQETRASNSTVFICDHVQTRCAVLDHMISWVERNFQIEHLATPFRVVGYTCGFRCMREDRNKIFSETLSQCENSNGKLRDISTYSIRSSLKIYFYVAIIKTHSFKEDSFWGRLRAVLEGESQG